MAKVNVGKEQYELVHNFGNGRGIVDMGGAVAMVDALPVAGEWELSGEPEREDEKAVFNSFVKLGTSVTVTAPDGSTKTFTDE